MAKVKIISNPYKKQVSYYSWNERAEEWMPISSEFNPNSRLLSVDLSKTFFPFVVNKIIDAILIEYQDENGQVEIEFEGTNDEYKDMLDICYSEEYRGKIGLRYSNKYLENARDILPDITDIFEHVKPLVEVSFNNTDRIESELKRFLEASADKVPICVMGNYSSGKSTFINALVGAEILPSGDEPITARIFRIEKSLYPDRATVSFEFNGEKIKIRYDDNSFKFAIGSINDAFGDELIKAISDIDDKNIYKMVNKTLELINDYGGDCDEVISDLVIIEIPFMESVLSKTSTEFVIFDTPGSNSASNDRHFKVLKKAMEGFSNGLPIFVSEYDSLDSTDNEKLYHEIRSMKELDDRFTMIIVNKADIARLPKNERTKEEEDRILSLAIPRNLYTEGIFFVSSIMGLGSKNNANFSDDHLAEIFEDQVVKYSDSSSRFYKTLYRYNIMPKQIKMRSFENSEKCENIVYANSGLYAIENEIKTFGNRYAPYNKCQQSHLFLSKVIQLTSEEIELTRTDRENFKQRISERLDKDKMDLMSGIEKRGNELETTYNTEYVALTGELHDTKKHVLSIEAIKKLEADNISKQEENHKLSDLKIDAEDSKKAMYSNLRANIANALKKHNLAAFKDVSESWKIDKKDFDNKVNEANDAQRDSYAQASDALIETIIYDFSSRMKNAKDYLEDESEKYWIDKLASIKDELIKIVTESSTLSYDRKNELTSIILDYQDLIYDKSVDEIFNKASFDKSVRFGKKIIVKDERLNLDKITRRYNSEYAESLAELAEIIKTNFVQSVGRWREKLISLLLQNIVEYNPTLHDQASVITETINKIKELENRQMELARYTEDIKKMMDWKIEED